MLFRSVLTSITRVLLIFNFIGTILIKSLLFQGPGSLSKFAQFSRVYDLIKDASKVFISLLVVFTEHNDFLLKWILLLCSFLSAVGLFYFTSRKLVYIDIRSSRITGLLVSIILVASILNIAATIKKRGGASVIGSSSYSLLIIILGPILYKVTRNIFPKYAILEAQKFFRKKEDPSETLLYFIQLEHTLNSINHMKNDSDALDAQGLWVRSLGPSLVEYYIANSFLNEAQKMRISSKAWVERKEELLDLCIKRIVKLHPDDFNIEMLYMLRLLRKKSGVSLLRIIHSVEKLQKLAIIPSQKIALEYIKIQINQDLKRLDRNLEHLGADRKSVV